MIRRSFFVLVLIFALARTGFAQSAQPIFDRLSKLRDVGITSPADTQVLTYDLASGKWKNAARLSLTGENYLSLSGSVLTANSVNLGGTNVTGTLSLARGGTSQTTAADSRGPNGLNIDRITSHGDSNYTVLATDRTVVTSATFTASRTWTMPLASSVNAGQTLSVYDAASAINGSNVLQINRAGSDTFAPPSGSSAITLNQALSGATFVSDGVSRWYVASFQPGSATAGTPLVEAPGVWIPAPYALPTSAGISGQILQSNGTNLVLSTPTWPASAGSAGGQVVSDGTNFVTKTPNAIQIAATNPAGTTSSTFVMMGLGSSWNLTPSKSGIVLINATAGLLNNTAGGVAIAQLRYGTGTAPANGAAVTGTALGAQVQYNVPTANFTAPMALSGIITGLTIGTNYWFDVALRSNLGTGTSSVNQVGEWAFEL